MDFVIFDLETTGLKHKNEQIIEIAALRIDRFGNTISKFHKLIKLYKVYELSEFIVNLTNITLKMLNEEGEDITSVMDEFFEFSKDTILVAQNARFDMSFLMQYFLEEQNKCYTPLYLDVINLAKVIYPQKKSYKLSKLVELFNISYNENAHHRADYDTKITTEIFIKQLEMLEYTGDYKKLLITAKVIQCSDKQADYLKVLMGKNNHYLENNHYFDKVSASFHIDFYLNN